MEYRSKIKKLRTGRAVRFEGYNRSVGYGNVHWYGHVLRWRVVMS